MDKNYTVLHLHSDLSNGVTNIDSVTKYDEYIDYAASLGMKAMAFSEHGSIFQWLKKKNHIEEMNMKYIHAEEFYVTENLFDSEGKKVRDNYHCLLIALNEDGFHEINRLSSVAFDDNHKYYAPRITFDELINTSTNIIVCTACIGGILYKGNESLKNRFIKFLSENKDRCYLEIQHHQDSIQAEYNKYLYELHKKYDIPLVATTDTHALNETHLKGRSILQKAKNIHFSDEDTWDITFKTYDELLDAFIKQNALDLDVVLEAIENTNRIADRVEPFKVTNEYKYPHLWENPEQLFKSKISKGVRSRGVFEYPNFMEYKQRIKHELEAYKHNGAIDFMLLMTDIIDWCKTQNINVGYGRGSVNGSVIAYLLGITEMDSIKHKLNFERFMNTERVSLSDIDTDFPPSRREEVKDYIISKEGLYCCDIITFNTIALKGAIRDVGRALEIPLQDVGDICNAVETDEDKMRQKYKELFEYVDIVNGTIVSVGSHPCGMVVAAHDVENAFGTFHSGTSKYPISQINMKEIDSLNYVKLDLLNLDTIELINNTCELAGIERLTPDNVDINDVYVWNSMRDDTTQIFQWEGGMGNKYIKDLLSDKNIKKFQEINENVDRMTLLSIGNSAIRPAGASYRDDLANGVVRKSGSDAIDKFLEPTFGYLVFQCQIIDFLHQYCGFTMGEADIVRRHFAKKLGTDKDIPIIKDGGYMVEGGHYIKGFVHTMKEKYDMPKEEAENTIVAFLQVIIDASSYLFSLNHSQPYSYSGYISAWLRYHYPLEFLTTALNINKDKEEKTLAITDYAKSRGININSIKFRYSKAEYNMDKETNSIYKGIESIKFCNKQMADELYELRNNKYDTFVGLLIDIQNLSVDSRQLEILIKLNFFEEFGNPNKLLKINELFNQLYGKKQFSKDKLPSYLTEELCRKYCVKESPKQFKFDDMRPIIDYLENNMNDIETSIVDYILYEIECLGYASYIDAKQPKTRYVVIDIINRKSYAVIKLYEIFSGKTREVKAWLRQLDYKPIEKYSVIEITKLKKDYKKEPTGEIDPKTHKKIWKKKEPVEYEYWLETYDVKA